MLWLTNTAAVPTTPPGRGDRAVSVVRSLKIDSKVTRYPASNSGAGVPGMGGGPKIMEKVENIRKTSKYIFVKSIPDEKYFFIAEKTAFGDTFSIFWGKYSSYN